MNKTFSGFCPTQQANFTVRVSYLDARDQSDKNPVYVKGTFRCDYTARGGKCDIVNRCPINALAPNTVRL
jgi:hypothetical protein